MSCDLCLDVDERQPIGPIDCGRLRWGAFFGRKGWSVMISVKTADKGEKNTAVGRKRNEVATVTKDSRFRIREFFFTSNWRDVYSFALERRPPLPEALECYGWTLRQVNKKRTTGGRREFIDIWATATIFCPLTAVLSSELGNGIVVALTDGEMHGWHWETVFGRRKNAPTSCRPGVLRHPIVDDQLVALLLCLLVITSYIWKLFSMDSFFRVEREEGVLQDSVRPLSPSLSLSPSSSSSLVTGSNLSKKNISAVTERLAERFYGYFFFLVFRHILSPSRPPCAHDRPCMSLLKRFYVRQRVPEGGVARSSMWANTIKRRERERDSE